MLIVGLTGGIGCGKSSAADIFVELGIEIIDTDRIAHYMTQAGGVAIPAIRDQFGDDFITMDGALDRQKMRQWVFSNSANRKKLEQLLHPLIHKDVARYIQKSYSPYVVVVIPLLFETGDYDHLIQRVLVIDCDEQLQIHRTMTRSQLDTETVKTIMATQVSRQLRLDKADDVVINNQDIDYLRIEITRLHHYYLDLAALQ